MHESFIILTMLLSNNEAFKIIAYRSLMNVNFYLNLHGNKKYRFIFHCNCQH